MTDAPTNGSRAPAGATSRGFLAARRTELGLTQKTLASKLGLDYKLIRKLENGGIVARNHPWLPALASGYNVHVEELSPYLADHELSERDLKRFATIKARGSSMSHAPTRRPARGMGSPGKPRLRQGEVPTGLAKVRYELGLTVKALARSVGVGTKMIHDLEAGRLPSNYPLAMVSRLAAAYNLPSSGLAPYLTGPALDETSVSRIVSLTGKPKRAKRGGRPPRAAAAERAPRIASAPAGARGTYNKLRSMPLPTRQLMRGLISECNRVLMKGDAYLQLDAIPVGAMVGFLEEFLRAKGVTETLLLSATFADHFDKA